MKKAYFVHRRSIPKGAAKSKDLLRDFEDAGLLDPVYDELKRRPGGTIRCEAGLNGLYFWIEYPDEPKDVTAFDVLLLLTCYMFVFALVGLALSYVDGWLRGGESRTELFVIRGAFFGGVATVLTFLVNRFDRVLFFTGFFVCATALALGVGIPGWMLVSRGDVTGLIWLLLLAAIHRAVLTEWS